MAKRFERARRYTEKYREKLKACYHCGWTGMTIEADLLLGKPVWSVTCQCGNYAWDSSVKRAVEKWNAQEGRK